MSAPSGLPTAAAPPAGDDPSRVRRGRVEGVDLARALAIVGMLVAHYVAREDHTSVPDAVRAFVDGRAMPLFVVLFGVSVTLLARGAAHPDRALLVRAAVFLPLGLALQEWTVGILIILPYYALFSVLAVGLRRLGDRALLVGAVLVTAAAAVTRQLLGPHWPGYLGWDGGRGVVPPWGLLAGLSVNGTYPALPSLAFVMVGMWLGRRDLADARLAVRLVAVGVAIGVVGYVGGRAIGDRVGATGVYVDGAGIPQLEPNRFAEVERTTGYRGVNLTDILPTQPGLRRATYEALVRYADDRTPVFRAARIFDASGHSEMPAWTIGATGCACAAIGACLLVADRARRALRPLVALGQLSLTAYVVQALAIRWTPAIGTRSVGEQYAVVAALAVGLVAFAWAWRRRFRRGPLEAALHALARP